MFSIDTMSEDWENVILLSADALRADHLSCYGYHRDTSPVLDELAEESIRFTNAYSASSHTREAVPALLTGKYPDVAVDSGYRLVTETIASTLSKEGFSTGGFHSNPYVSRAYGFDEGFDKFDDDLNLGQNRFIALAQRAWDKLRGRHYARASEINARSLEWLESVDEPFFLWNHYMDTHGPYEPPGEYATLYSETGGKDRDVQTLYQRAIDEPDSITEEERELLINLYDAEIRYNSDLIGEFLEELDRRGLLENSLVVFTADHGDAFYEHGYYEHPRYLHDEITHVPLLVREPGRNSVTVEAPVSTLDITSTIANKVVGEADGVSLFEEIPENRTVFSQARGEYENDHLWRYAARSEGGVSLCERNQETDEMEFTGDGGEVLRDELKDYVERRVRRMNGEEPESEHESDAEIERRLEALGYKE